MGAIHAFVGGGENGLGEEIITNGDFSTASGWTLGADWTISSGRANYASGGSGTALRFTTGPQPDSSQDRTFRLSFDIVAGTGSVYATLMGFVLSDSGTTRTGAGTYTEDLVLPSTAGDVDQLRFNGSGSSAVSIDNVSLKRVF